MKQEISRAHLRWVRSLKGSKTYFENLDILENFLKEIVKENKIEEFSFFFNSLLYGQAKFYFDLTLLEGLKIAYRKNYREIKPLIIEQLKKIHYYQTSIQN